MHSSLLLGFNRSKLLVDGSDTLAKISSRSHLKVNGARASLSGINSESRSSTVIPLSRTVDGPDLPQSLDLSESASESNEAQFIRMEALLAEALDTPLIELKSQVDRKVSSLN